MNNTTVFWILLAVLLATVASGLWRLFCDKVSGRHWDE